MHKRRNNAQACPADGKPRHASGAGRGWGMRESAFCTGCQAGFGKARGIAPVGRRWEGILCMCGLR